MILPAPNIRWHWILLLFNINWFSHIDAKEVRVVCYYTNWSVYRPGTAKFSPQNINPYLCTHLIYAFGGFTKDNILKPFDKYQDIEKGGYAKFTGLKTYNKQLKTMLAIGGWNEGSSKFSPLVASTERRRELVKNVVKFLRQNHFDGLDLDWEYPSFRDGGKPRDRDNYAQFVQELREEFERENEKTGRPRLLLTMAVPAGIEYIDKGYDIPKLTKYLDWMNILSYDYHSAFEPSVNHHAPLYPLEAESEYNYDTELNIDYTIKHYLKLGADSRKLVLGIPTYGRSYTLFNSDSNEIGAPADGPGDMGDATRENGYLAYYEICEYVKSKSWSVIQPNEDAMGPYAFKDNQWVGYDDENIVRRKAEYVAKNNLGGIMFWAIDNDDFRGVCHDKPYPLIEASKEALIKAYSLGNQTSAGSHKTSSRTRTRTRPSTISRPSTTESTINETDHVEKPSRRRPSNKSSSRKGAGSRRRRPSSTRGTTSTTEEPLIVGSSLVVTTPSYKTPEPPTTPDPGGDFKCEDEGFFPHPRDCKKYFWCLAGPSELGIIAHQFTCPAGLYFNKAASSCDYTQNVLCNKKRTTTTTSTTPATAISSKSTTTERTLTDSPVASIFSTRRPPPKITAATSRTTLKVTTTTKEPEYDEEDYEEYEEDELAADKGDSEEDPQVIKELLNLIKKAGGIEELEKQLKLHDSSDGGGPPGGHDGKSAKSTISKELYERVLKRTKSNEDRENNINNFRYNTINRNSRGPQNLGITPEVREKTNTKYSTITRQRNGPQGDKFAEGDEEEERAVSAKSPNIPEYVTIRRTRYSTTEANLIDEDGLRDDDDEENHHLSHQSFDYTTSKSSSGPQYISIRRTRPTTKSSNEIPSNVETSSSPAATTTAKPSYIAIRRSRPTTTTSTTTTTERTSASVKTTETTTQTSARTAEELSTIAAGSSSAGPESESRTAIPVVEVVDERTTEYQPPQAIPDNPTSGTNTSPISSLTPNTQEGHQTSPPSIPSKSFIQLAKPRPFSFTPRLLIRPSSSSTSTTEAPNKVSEPPHSAPTPLVHNPSNRGTSRFRLNATANKDQLPQFASSKEEVRHYRPDIAQEISDLSSLTALDLALSSGEVGSTHRGRRPTNPTKYTQSALLGEQQESSSTVRPTRKVIRVIRPQLRQRLPLAPPSLTTGVPDLLHNSILYSRNRLDSDEDQAEDENINLSETIRQESNDIGNSFGSTDEKGRRIIKRIRSTTVGPTAEVVGTAEGDEDATTTTAHDNQHPLHRTRKIVRKLPATTESAPHEFRISPHLGRTRKIIRRLSTTPSAEDNVVSSTVRSRLLTYSRTRPTTTQSTTAGVSTEAVPLDVTTLHDVDTEEDDVLTTLTTTPAETSTDSVEDDSLNTILDNSSTDNILSTKGLDEDVGTTFLVQSTTEEVSTSTAADTTAKSTTLNYVNKSIRNRIRLQEASVRDDGTVKIRPGKLSPLGHTRPSYFGGTNKLEDRPEKPLTERPTNSYRRNRFRPKSSSTTEDALDDFKGTTSGSASYRKKPYRFRSTTRSSTTAAAEGVLDDEHVEEIEDDKAKSTYVVSTSTTQKSQTKLRFRPSFSSSTTTSTTTERSDKDNLDLNNKRKQLFSRDKVMNTPYFGSTSTLTEGTMTSDSTTEKPTTLHHVFAQTDPVESSTDAVDELSTKKVERLIEISRIVDTGDVENKIGEISRITSIKIVDNEINGTRFSDGPVYIHDSERHEKKYDGISKDSKPNTNIGNVITIDGKSSVQTITARPFSKNESSTIPLEGLFQTESPFKTEVPPSDTNSPLVKIRLLVQDPFGKAGELDKDGKLVPIRVLTQEVTMKANVVEVKADPSGADTIRIAPITFEKQIKSAQ